MVGKVGGNPAAILKKMEGLAKSDDGQISAGEQEILNQLQGALGKLEDLDKRGTGAAGDDSAMPPGVMDNFRALAKADDGKIDGTEQAVLSQLQSAFENIENPQIRELISQVAQRMGLAGAHATARMASGLSADGPQGSPAASAGGADDPLRCNSCGGGGSSSTSGASGGSSLPALGGKGGMMFEDMLAQFLFDVIKEMQEELKKKMAQYKAMSKSGKGGGGGGAGGADSDSRQLLFEEIKNLMQKMQQMIQSLSNILNTLHNGAMNAIRNIR
jgi:hypothetical protein